MLPELCCTPEFCLPAQGLSHERKPVQAYRHLTGPTYVILNSWRCDNSGLLRMSCEAHFVLMSAMTTSLPCQ